MKRTLILSIAVFACTGGFALADTFGADESQFDIKFVTISGETNPASGYGVVNDDYRISTCEITNTQWNKFVNEYGTVTGSPPEAYNPNYYLWNNNLPTFYVSWYSAAQFVNWLNTSSGHQAAYKFTGTQGTGDYTFSVWDVTEAAGGTNLYRHKDAYYFLPTEDEWVKAAYWNGTNLQTYATVGDVDPTQDGWNFYDDGYATDPPFCWAVGSGIKELNGTYDMMGNVSEWLESPRYEEYLPGAFRGICGGSYRDVNGLPESLYATFYINPTGQSRSNGFRVASVPEPAAAALLGAGALLLHRKRNNG